MLVSVLSFPCRNLSSLQTTIVLSRLLSQLANRRDLVHHHSLLNGGYKFRHLLLLNFIISMVYDHLWALLKILVIHLWLFRLQAVSLGHQSLARLHLYLTSHVNNVAKNHKPEEFAERSY